MQAQGGSTVEKLTAQHAIFGGHKYPLHVDIASFPCKVAHLEHGRQNASWRSQIGEFECFD